VDNSPEFPSKELHRWAYRRQVDLHFVDPTKPVPKAFVESFKSIDQRSLARVAVRRTLTRRRRHAFAPAPSDAKALLGIELMDPLETDLPALVLPSVSLLLVRGKEKPYTRETKRKGEALHRGAQAPLGPSAWDRPRRACEVDV
jgi:hypothetical protein